jgi:Tfp pilus assembly PilM family ATPase
MKTPLFYHKRPIFGLDIGSQTVKFLQPHSHKHHATVVGYGSVATDEKIVKDGVITDIPRAAKLVDDLLANNCEGVLTTNRVVMSIPVSHVYTRVLTMPVMSKKNLIMPFSLKLNNLYLLQRKIFTLITKLQILAIQATCLYVWWQLQKDSRFIHRRLRCAWS